MSLLDALLLEPAPLKAPTDERVVFIALRNDGVAGSGTIDDPYNGSVSRGPELPVTLALGEELDVTAMTWAEEFDVTLERPDPINQPRIVTVAFGGPHGYVPGIVVTISGATGADAGIYNGDFGILSEEKFQTSSFQYQLASVPSGNPQGTIKCKAKRIVEITAAGPQVAHAVDDFVTISNVGGADGDTYEGTFRIVSVVSPTVFTYELASEPTDPPEIDAQTTCTVRKFAVATLADHGYANGDLIAIDGATGESEDYLKWTFPITVLSDTSFKFNIASAPADAAGSITCQKVVYWLDKWLAAQPAKTAIHLGPGVFETRGNQGKNEVPGVWNLADGQGLIGSGIGITTLKLIVTGIPLPHVNYAVVGAAAYYNDVNGFEVADLSADCSLDAHPYGKPYSVLATSAINIVGSHIRVRRIRAFNFGTQSLAAECFAVFAGGKHERLGELVNNVIEDCIIEEPSSNNVRETTCVGISAQRASAIRNCVLDMRYPGGKSSYFVGISSIQLDFDLTYRVTTASPHGRVAGQNVVITGVKTGADSRTWNLFNGDFLVDEVFSETEFNYTLRRPPPTSITNYHIATMGVSFNGGAVVGGTGAVFEKNRSYHVTRGSYKDFGWSRDMVIRENYFHHAYTGIYQFMTKFFLPNPSSVPAHTLVRDATDHTIAIFTVRYLSGGMAVEAPHGLQVGQIVLISGAEVVGDPGVPSPYYNGIFAIRSVPSSPAVDGLPASFTYQMIQDPGGSAASSPSPNYQYLFQTQDLVAERNVSRIPPSPPADRGPSAGFILSDDRSRPNAPWVFPKVLVRENVFLPVAAVADTRMDGISLEIGGGAATVEGNILDLTNTKPIINAPLCFPRYAGNQTPGGTPVPAYAKFLNPTTYKFRDSLESKVEDSYAMALF